MYTSGHNLDAPTTTAHPHGPHTLVRNLTISSLDPKVLTVPAASPDMRYPGSIGCTIVVEFLRAHRHEMDPSWWFVATGKHQLHLDR